MKLVVPPDLLVVLLSPTATFDQRMDAVHKLADDSWLKGWQACDEATEAELVKAGMPVVKPVLVQ